MIRIGVSGPFSGPRAAYGVLIEDAVSAASARSVGVIWGDDRADPQQAAAVARRFIAVGVEAVVGHFNSECARTAGVLYRDAGVPFLMPAATAPDLCEVTGGYRLCAPETAQIGVAAAWLAQSRHRLIDTWSDGSAYANRLRTLLLERTRIESPTGGPGVVAVFGAHRRVAGEIADRGRTAGATFLAPDDCAIAEFDALLAGCGARVFVATPVPSFFDATRTAIGVIADAQAAGVGTAAYLSSHAGFSRRQAKAATFRLVERRYACGDTPPPVMVKGHIR